MATLVTNRSTGILPLPSLYGGGLLAPGQFVIISDTPSNVAFALGNPSSNYVDFELVTDNQTGAITPATEGAAGTESYTPATAGNWSSTVPRTTATALDKLAANGAGGAGNLLGGVLTGHLPSPGMAAGAAATNLGSAGGALAGTYPSPTLASGAAAANLGSAGGDLTGTYPSPTVAAGAITFAKAKAFVSTVQTGTGASQNIPHGLGVTPSAVLIVPYNVTAATYTAAEGSHSSTNVVVTVATGDTFKVLAWA